MAERTKRHRSNALPCASLTGCFNLTSQPEVAVLTHVRLLVQAGFVGQPRPDCRARSFSNGHAPYLRLLVERATYVREPDGSFAWKCTEQKKIKDATLTHLEFVSQTWRGHFWSHHLLVLRPTTLRQADIAMLFITDDGYKAPAEKEADPFHEVAQRAGGEDVPRTKGARASYVRMERGCGWRTTVTPDLTAFLADLGNVLPPAAPAGERFRSKRKPFIRKSHRPKPPRWRCSPRKQGFCFLCLRRIRAREIISGLFSHNGVKFFR